MLLTVILLAQGCMQSPMVRLFMPALTILAES